MDLVSATAAQPLAPRRNELVAAGLQRFHFFVQYYEPIRRTTYHTHPGLEINVINEGRGRLILDGANDFLAPRQAVVFSGERPHTLRAMEETSLRRTVICVDPERLRLGSAILQDLAAVPKPWSLSASAYREFEHLAVLLDRELREEKIGWEVSSEGILAQIVALLRRSIESSAAPAQKTSGAPGGADLVEGCREYIRSHLDKPISLSTLAEQFFVSPGHLARRFRRQMGTTVHEYILSERMAEAKRLLVTQPQLSVTDVALRVGFTSISHFSRTFRRYVGHSPRAYRKLFDHA